MRKGRSKGFVGLFVRAFVLAGIGIAIGRFEQRPLLPEVPIGVSCAIPFAHPVRVFLIVIGAGNKPAGTALVPKRFAQIAAGNDGPAVFDRHRKQAGSTVGR